MNVGVGMDQIPNGKFPDLLHHGDKINDPVTCTRGVLMVMAGWHQPLSCSVQNL